MEGQVRFFVPNADMIVATRILAAAFYSVVVYAYAGDAWAAIRRPVPRRPTSSASGSGCPSSRTSHRPSTPRSSRWPTHRNGFLNAETVPLIMLFSTMAAVLHVAARGSIDGEVPRRRRIGPRSLRRRGGADGRSRGGDPAGDRPGDCADAPSIGDGWWTGELPFGRSALG